MREVWVNIEEDYYISNLGRVKSLKREKEIIMKPFKHGRKIQVGLTLENNSRIRQINLASFVAKTFIDPKVKKVIRLDGNIWNNSVENLKVYL